MVQLLADENFNHRVLRGLRCRLPVIDCLLAQETEICQREDREMLDWAALHNRVVLTHDVKTMTNYAYERLAAGQPSFNYRSDTRRFSSITLKGFLARFTE